MSDAHRETQRYRRLHDLARAAGKALPGRTRLRDGAIHAVLGVASGLLAWLPGHALGWPESYWAAITAVGVAQTELPALRSNARDRILGAATGGAVGALVAALLPQGVTGYALGVAGAILLAWLLNAVSAARLAAVTATIILLVPHQGSAGGMTLARIGEVCWGIVAAVIVTWPVAVLLRRL